MIIYEQQLGKINYDTIVNFNNQSIYNCCVCNTTHCFEHNNFNYILSGTYDSCIMTTGQLLDNCTYSYNITHDGRTSALYGETKHKLFEKSNIYIMNYSSYMQKGCLPILCMTFNITDGVNTYTFLTRCCGTGSYVCPVELFHKTLFLYCNNFVCICALSGLCVTDCCLDVSAWNVPNISFAFCFQTTNCTISGTTIKQIKIYSAGSIRSTDYPFNNIFI